MHAARNGHPHCAEPKPGSIFAGDYRIEHELARGGMGTVYVVEQLSTGRKRALKLLHSTLRNDPHAQRYFAQEARVRARIASAHVVEVHAAGVDRELGLPWLVMELLEGETLEARVRARGPLAIAEAAIVFRHVCHAVAAAHDAAVLHRDLKPENVFLSRQPRACEPIEVKVLDFGIAKLGAYGIASGPGVVGTPIWMAPEQALRETLSPATDVWPLGLMAFFVLTGKAYWHSASMDASFPELLREVLVASMPSASSRAIELGASTCVPRGFDAWFARCTNRNPTARFQSVVEAWSELSQIFGTRGSMVPRASLRTTLSAGSMDVWGTPVLSVAPR